MKLRQAARIGAAVFVLAVSGASVDGAQRLVVGYESTAQLERAVRNADGRIVRRLDKLRTAEVVARPAGLSRAPGIEFVHEATERYDAAEPGLVPTPADGRALEWQFAATHADDVPEDVLRAASTITIAVIDTGADVTAPDLAAKSVQTYDLATRSTDVADPNGHGTFVASLAAGSVTNGDGIAGFGGDANLLVVRAAVAGRFLTDVDSAAAIVYAVDHGARIVNLSFGGPGTSAVERRAIDYAVAKGALVVAAIGNEYGKGNAVQYPAALLQPVGSKGRGGRGLVVGGSNAKGTRASFSSTGTHLSLVAPATGVLGAVSSLSSPTSYPRVALPGARGGLYGFGSGTSYAAPQVAGAAALVWAANHALTAKQVAQILKGTASGKGRWNRLLGYGQINVAAAVARAQTLR